MPIVYIQHHALTIDQSIHISIVPYVPSKLTAGAR